MNEIEKLKNELRELKNEFERYKLEESKYLKIVPLYHCPCCFSSVEEFERNGDLVFFRCLNTRCGLYNKNNYYTNEYIDFISEISRHQQNGL